MIEAILKYSSQCDAMLEQYWQNENIESAFWPYKKVIETLSQTNNKMIFLQPSNNVQGFCLYSEVSEGIIEVLYIHTSLNNRKKGVAKKLIESLCCHHSRKTEIWLEVNATNKTAIQFYFKLGFKQTGFRQKYYRNGDDALVLTLLS